MDGGMGREMVRQTDRQMAIGNKSYEWFAFCRPCSATPTTGLLWTCSALCSTLCRTSQVRLS